MPQIRANRGATSSSRTVLRSAVRGALLAGLFLALAPAPDARVQTAPDARVQTAASLRERVEAHVRALADDSMAGRRTGSPEAVAAAEYLAEALRLAGAEPAGDDGTYLQRVPMGVTRYTEVPRLALELADGSVLEAIPGVNFDLSGGSGERALASVRHVRDVADVPAEPDGSAALFLDVPWRDSRAWTRDADDGAGWGLLVTRGATSPGRSADDRPPRDRRSIDPTPVVRVRGDVLELFERDEVRGVRFRAPAELERLDTFNVVGRIRGAGERAAETVVFSAHYDHLGVSSRAAEGEDAIYNGADDDASGCAAVVEVARALAAGEPPARTLVFLLATGEEIGLVGTRYYLEHPAEPLETTVANLNFEMIGRPDALAGGPGHLWLTGFERSNLGPAFAELGLPLVADPRPEQNFFQRSDNYAFALRGIVAQTLSSYDLHEDYHTVRDEADTLDYDHLAACVEASIDGARALADGRLTPEWSPGANPARDADR